MTVHPVNNFSEIVVTAVNLPKGQFRGVSVSHGLRVPSYQSRANRMSRSGSSNRQFLGASGSPSHTPATIAQYKQALEAFTFKASQVPGLLPVIRTITVNVTDDSNLDALIAGVVLTTVSPV